MRPPPEAAGRAAGTLPSLVGRVPPVALLVALASAVAADEWRDLADIPTARQEVGVAALEDAVYVVGGILANRSATNLVERFFPATGRWERVSDLPRALHHIAVVALEGRLFTVGGLDSTFQGVDSCFVFDPEAGDAGSWDEIEALPTRRGAVGAAVLGGKIYAAGGQSGSPSFTDFAAFDPDQGSWEPLPAMPTARNHLAAAAAGGFFYALSGRAGGLRPEVERYDPVARSWKAMAPIPTPRGGIAAAAIGTSIFVFGGEGNNDLPSGVFPDVERYDTVRDSWAARTDMQAPRHGIGAGVVGDLIVIPGGSEVEGFGVTAVNDAYAPSPEDLPPFRRGDVDSSGLDISDPIAILNRLFTSGPPFLCDDAADANDDGTIDISDPIAVLLFLFLGAPVLPPPAVGESGDPTPDLLGCGN
jgi:N-acetylneuraminic acid mutarotase